MVTGILVLALQAAAPPPVEPQDPDRPQASVGDFRALTENNIFAPFKPKRFEPRESRRESRSEAPKARSKPPVVTGFVFDPKVEVHQVIVEDKNVDSLRLFLEPKFLKVGDEVAGCKIESVALDRCSVRVGEKSVELKAGDSLPETRGPESSAVESAPAEEAKPAGESNESTLERLKKERARRRNSDER